MMNINFDQLVRADAETREGVFNTTAQRLGSTPSNIEKDFWVCWTLDVLFNGLPGDHRLLFKGGTSLSKGFGLISRFSEDIDVTVFREDLDSTTTVETIKDMSKTARGKWLDALKATCSAYIQGDFRAQLTDLTRACIARNGLEETAFTVEVDPDDKDGQTLLLRYPAVTAEDAYVRKVVKIESGAKSALDPHTSRTVRPYADDDLPEIDLAVPNVTTVAPERTFWDKVVIVHGLRRTFDAKGILRGDGQRVSRHYYDLHRLMEAGVAARALADMDLGANCVLHARLFFFRADADQASARPGSFALVPHDGMIDRLRADYVDMSGMIFGPVPDFDVVMASVSRLEAELNAAAPWHEDNDAAQG
ncbi:nucleotidyl transferase AbiEii/AbiGii toxin family protein [Caulobacter sp.]|uniref:nucleotidyl transferase AbiEii/AbiGii toxin family protein n=1 Tax=Caulobacter sp. TaxID=78 RepID=UPI0031D71989